MRAMRFRVACILPLIAVSAIAMLAASPAPDSAQAGRVWGRVSYNGRPLRGGVIVFVPIRHEEGSSTGGAQIGQDGSYSIDSDWQRVPNLRAHYKICIVPRKRNITHRA